MIFEKKLSRRAFVKGSVSTLALSSLPLRFTFAQSAPAVRLEWEEYKSSPHYASYIDALRSMRANTDASNPASWAYWTNIHVNYCPHKVRHFLAWHRGYLHHFEQQLRIVSGNADLVLPYWDYYKSPIVPREFTDAATGNPLYERRINTNVTKALTLAPFSPSITNFPRGTSNPFETSVETAPHGPVHNILGAVMATMKSPTDPIFWLHHANIDRMWAAWVAVGGKWMPSLTESYWSGSFTYAAGRTLERRLTYDIAGLGYTYSDMSLPSALPMQARAARLVRVQARAGRGLGRPALRTFPTTPSKETGNNRLSLGGVTGITLADESISAQIPIQAAARQPLEGVLAAARGGGGVGGGGGTPPGRQFKSAQIVLDGVSLTEAGRAGGYFYNVFVNLPVSGDATESYLLETIGPFEIESAGHHGAARFVLPATRLLARTAGVNPSDVTVSLVRVNGDNAPSGPVIGIRELRVEVSGDEIE